MSTLSDLFDQYLEPEEVIYEAESRFGTPANHYNIQIVLLRQAFARIQILEKRLTELEKKSVIEPMEIDK